jgi:hypothetical protein
MHNRKCSCNKIHKIVLNILRIDRSPKIFLNVFSMIVIEVERDLLFCIKEEHFIFLGEYFYILRIAQSPKSF